MFICKNLNIEVKRSKLMLNCEFSEAKRTCSIVDKIISKRSKHVYIEDFEYRSEANRFNSDFVFKKTKKIELSFFFKTKCKKRKGSIVNYRSFAITSRDLYKERPLEKWKTDAYAEHTHQFLTRMLSMPTSSLRVCSACAPVPDAYAQHTHKGWSMRVRKSNFLIIF
jgi:hypothetical protein